MMSLDEVISVDNLPSLDIHGEYADVARVLVESYINDNYKMKNNLFCIVHGIGSGVLRKATHEVLKKNKKVINFKTFYYNHGCTVVEIEKKH